MSRSEATGLEIYNVFSLATWLKKNYFDSSFHIFITFTYILSSCRSDSV